jgi:hypothetical protein
MLLGRLHPRNFFGALVRASTINPSQLAIRIKVIFSYLVGGERRGERRDLMQEPALARAPRHFERVKDGPCIDKVVLLYSPLLYMLTIRWL